jgi:hypothetical protein
MKDLVMMGRRKRTVFTSAIIFSLLLPTWAHALPKEGEAVRGSTTIRQPTADTLHIDQVTDPQS